MLFDDNIGFITFDFPENSKVTSPKLEDVKEGFLKGNMFTNEYIPYKNYMYSKIVPRTKREELLLEIMELCFAINDLNLYLDLHPTDQEILKKFQHLVEKSCLKEMEYVKQFGPIDVIDVNNSQQFNWIDDPWPWQNEGGAKYV